jgi:hypothetical protein
VAIPTTPVLILRFPDGDVEYRTTRGKLPVGSLVRARGTHWRVKAYKGESAILESDGTDGGDGAPGQPIVLPDPLGDTPLTVEVMSEV